MRGTEHTTIERELLALANRQHGVLHDGQLTRRGLTRRAIDHRVDTGRLTRLHAGVFSWGHSALTREGRWLAALWACPGAALSHGTAAAFHAIGREPSTGVHVSTTRRSLHSRPGIVVHRVARLDAVDVLRSSLLRVTRPPRTIVDLADDGGWAAVRGAADALRSFSPALLREAQSRAPGRTGRGLVTRLLAADEAHTKSELDGRAYHERRSQMEADHLRDEGYQLAGHRILRLLWDDLDDAQAPRTAARLRRMLDRRVP